MTIDIGRVPKFVDQMAKLGPDFRQKAVDVEARFIELGESNGVTAEMIRDLLAYLPSADGEESLGDVDQAVLDVARHCAGQLAKAAEAGRFKVDPSGAQLLRRYAGDDFEEAVEQLPNYLGGLKAQGQEIPVQDDYHGNVRRKLTRGHQEVVRGNATTVARPVQMPAGGNVYWQAAEGAPGVPCTLYMVHHPLPADVEPTHYLEVASGPHQGQYVVDVQDVVELL